MNLKNKINNSNNENEFSFINKEYQKTIKDAKNIMHINYYITTWINKNAGYIINQIELLVKNGESGNIGNGKIYFTTDIHQDIIQELKLFLLGNNKNGVAKHYKFSTIKLNLKNIIKQIVLNDRRFRLSTLNENQEAIKQYSNDIINIDIKNVNATNLDEFNQLYDISKILTKIQYDICILLINGYSKIQVAKILNISRNMVYKHITNIKIKLVANKSVAI